MTLFKSQVTVLEQAKAILEAKLLDEQKKLSNLFIDAEQLRSDLHKEIKDYRSMKRKLKSIILQFKDRLEDLRNREITRELETQDQFKFEEALEKAGDFMQS